MVRTILSLFLSIGLLTYAPSESLATDLELNNAIDTAMQEEISTETPLRRAGPKAIKELSGAVNDDVPPANLPTGQKVDKNYKVRAGDVLHITVWREENMDQEVLVLPDGTISFPLIGSVNIEGMTTTGVQHAVKNKLSSLIPDASVTVIVKATLGNAVSIIGQVGKPGEIIMNHGLTVMQALSQAGGLTPYADDSEIIILRRINGKEESIEYPYDEIIRGRELEKNIDLLPGDVVIVPTAGLF